jgi:hypothetical protein
MSDDADDIVKEIEAEEARRPLGREQRCFNCAFWEISKEYGDRVVHDDDRRGECHRHAPQILQNYVAEALGLIAWAVEEAANVEHNDRFDYAHECEASPFIAWPRTTGDKWCGDFVKRLNGRERHGADRFHG